MEGRRSARSSWAGTCLWSLAAWWYLTQVLQETPRSRRDQRSFVQRRRLQGGGQLVGKLRAACWPSSAQAEMHSGPRIRTQLSLFLLSGPPSFVLQLPEDRPLHMLSATGLLVAFGLGKDWGLPGPTRRERPRTVTPWAQSQCPQRAIPVLPFLEWGRAGDREEARPRQDLRHCPATGSRPHMCP